MKTLVSSRRQSAGASASLPFFGNVFQDMMDERDDGRKMIFSSSSAPSSSASFCVCVYSVFTVGLVASGELSRAVAG